MASKEAGPHPRIPLAKHKAGNAGKVSQVSPTTGGDELVQPLLASNELNICWPLT